MYGLLNGMIAMPVTLSKAEGHFCCFKPLHYPWLRIYSMF